MTPAISVDNLTKMYGETAAVNGLSFAVPRGAKVALLGANGAGKTTTIAMLLGLLLPTSGRIEILGHDMVKNRFAALPQMNFSSPYVDLPHRLTVRQNLAVYANLYSVPQWRDRIEKLAVDLNFAQFLSRPFGQLSAGQKTRVMLAKSLLNEPQLLLLDEPTASVDPETADRLRRYLANYCARTGATLFMASHNMFEVEKLCDDVLVMKAGKLMERGSPADLINQYGRDNLEEVFLHIARSNDDEWGIAA